ncbi:hypothetical protein ABPG74_018922, partial [Tetrahymena malaccensis]
MNPTQNLSTPNQLSQKVLDSNQKSDPKSSSSITKEYEEQNFDILNEENYQDVNQLSKEEDIEGLQNQENSQSDENEFSKNNKSHLVSQMNEEEESENQNLNQENLLGAKKQGEDLSIPLSFHSDLTLKKKIKSSFNRNLAKSEFFQNGTLQVFNNKEVQNAIVTYKNEENNICHQYQSTAFISKDNSKQQIIQDQDSQTQTIRKGKQNIFEKKLLDKQQQQDKQQNNSKIFANQIIEDKKNSNDFELPDKSNQDKQENKETIFKSMSKSDQPQPKTSTLLENQGSAKQLEIEKQFAINIKNEENNICHQYQSTDQDSQTQTIRKGKLNIFQKKLSDKQQQQDQQQNNSKILLENQSSAKQLEIEKQLAIKYASQIQEIANQIEEFQINENELDQSKFENINESQIQILDSNQKSVPKSSSSITKEQEEQNFDILNEENYEDVNQLSKEEDIEGIQNLENSQSDEKEFSKNNKSHLVSQMNEEEESENQNLNQENLLGAKKQGEDLSIPQSFHSDLTLKKKIKSSFNRNLAKSEFFQNGTFQVFNNKEVQNAIITYKNEENNICHQYQSTAFISKDNSKQQIIHDQDSQTQTIRKGKQNIFEKKLSDKQQQQDKQQNNSKIFANQIIEDKKNSNDFELPDKSNQDKQENKETIFKSMSKSDQPQPETSTLLENQGSAKQLEIEKQFAINIKNEENNICHQYQSTDQDSQTQTIRKGKQNTFEKKLSDKQQQQDQQQNNSKILLENQSSAKQLEIEKQLAIKYASQIQEIANKIEEFQINENELDQSKFENINESQIQNLDSNQKSNSKSSPSIMKEQEDKYFDTLNKENSQDVKQLSKEDIEEIQNKENSLSDEKELPKKTKSHQISQTTEEKQSENQILNQGNILNAKTDGEDQNIPISLDSDLTQKKKIKCSINRNQAKRPNDELSIEKKLTEKKQYSDKQEKEEKIFDSEIIKDKKSSNGLVIPDEQIQDKQQNKEWIFDGISKSDQPQPDAFNLQVDQIKTKQLEIEKQLTITYASQLEKIANQIKELKINGKDLDQQKFESINESQIQNLDSNQQSDQKSSPIIAKEQEKKNFDILNEENAQDLNQLSKEEDIEGVQIRENSQSDEKEFSKNNKSHRISQIIEEEESENQNLNQENLLDAKKQGEDQIPFHSDLTLKKKIQSSFNRNLAKKQEEKNFHILNEENYQDVKQLPKEDIEEIQNQENSQSDEKEFSKNNKSHLVSQMTEEEVPKNQILNQENLFGIKKYGEEQSIYISFHSDLTLKKKIKHSINRNSTKKEFFQNATFQVFNDKEVQNAIITYKNQENKICLKYQSTASNLKDVQKQQIIQNQNSQTQTIRKGKQNNLENRLSEKQQPSDQPIPDTSTLQGNQSNTKQLEIEKRLAITEDQAELLKDQLSNEKKLSDQRQPDTSAFQEDQNRIKQLEIEKELAITNAAQIEKIVNQIKEFKINENDLDQLKQEFKSSHTLIKNDEQKIIDSGYKEIFENLFNLLNQEMEKIYNEQNTQSDQKDLAKNIKSHQVSQMIKKEPENQILNQVNISNTKKEKEYQIIVYISFHSDLTFKKKIKSNINRNLAKNKFYDGHSYVSQQYTQISKFVQKQLDFSDLLQAKSYTKMQAPQIQIIINQIKELNIDEKLLELQRFENIKENRLL